MPHPSLPGSAIRIGIGGWTFEPWRGAFYPDKLPRRRELEYASRQLSSIEINGTYYGSQKRESFARWHDETPDDFVFALKGPRFATNRRALSTAGDSIERFLASGITALGAKLGPINWQFMASKAFNPDDFEEFLKLLPTRLDGLPLRHAVEVRHPSFRTAEFVALARAHGVAIVLAADGPFPQVAAFTAPFVYLRIMGTREEEACGYAEAALDAWAGRARRLAGGEMPGDLDTGDLDAGGLYTAGAPGAPAPREVFLYVISGFKPRNPAAARGLLERL